VLTTGYEMEAFAPKSQRVMVEIDPMVVKRQEIRIDQHVAASVEDFIDGMTKAVASAPKAQGGDWVEYCRYLKAELDVMKEPHKHTGSSINYYDIIDALNRLSGDDDVVVTDAGLAFYLVGQAFKPKPGQHVINSGGLGSMGFAMGAAVGAATANPKRRVICLTGDGSLQCNVQELATYAANRLNIALVIVNNGGYVSIRNTQNNYFGGLLVGSSDTSGVVMPDLAKLCAAYGLPYTSVKALDGLNGVLGEALKAPGPVVCEVFIPHENEVIPSVMSKKRDDGTMESKPLHDMYPFFPDQKVKDLMFEGWLAKKAR
jgi:acetolactate synthase-1/2/3 large subunit